MSLWALSKTQTPIARPGLFRWGIVNDRPIRHALGAAGAAYSGCALTLGDDRCKQRVRTVPFHAAPASTTHDEANPKPDLRSPAAGIISMLEEPFVPPPGAFTRTVAIRFSHCDPAGIVYFPNYFDMFNGLIEDWYTEQLGVDYANLILNEHFGFPFVHIETDFKIPSRMGEHLDLTLLLTRIGRSSLSVVIVGHLAGVERLRARLVTAMMSLETQHAVELPHALRDKFEIYLKRTGPASG
jgi:4-hydroxybenzoyl-CoA thioesterase